MFKKLMETNERCKIGPNEAVGHFLWAAVILYRLWSPKGGKHVWLLVALSKWLLCRELTWHVF